MKAEEVSINQVIEDPSIQRKMNALSPYKGYFSKDTLYYAFDAVDYCIGARCRAFDYCPYEKPKVSEKTGEVIRRRCQFQQNYLRGVSLMIWRNYYETITEIELFHVGMELMPLYKNLAKLNLREMAVEDVVYTDDKGIMRSHPVYKEIRDTIRQISMLWKSLGLQEVPEGPSEEQLFANGNPDYYDNLEKSHEKEKADRKAKKILKRKVKDEDH